MALNLPNITNPFSKYSQPNNTAQSTVANLTPAGSSKPTSAPVYTATPTPLKPVVDSAPVSYGGLTTPKQTPAPVNNMEASNKVGNTASNYVTTSPEPTQRESALNKLSSLLEKQGTQADVTLALQKENQLAEKRQKLNDITAKANRIDRDFENQERALMQNPTGLGGGALTQELNNLRRDRNQQMADLAIERAVAQGDVNTALTVIKDAVDAQFEPIKNQIESTKTFLTLYNNDLSDSEKAILESNLRMQETGLKTQAEQAKLQKEADTYKKLLETGDITIDKVPKEALAYLNTQGYTSPEQKASVEKSLDLATKTNKLLSDLAQGGSTAIGAGIQRPFGAIGAFFGVGSYEERKTQIENIKSLLTLENTKYLKGAMSDKDILLLQNASSELNPNMPEKDFVKKLQALSDKITTSLISSKAVPMSTKEELLTAKIIRDNPKATPEQVAEMVDQMLPQATSFNSAGNATASNIANAIKTVESGGNYNARGASGEVGAYQFMPSVWKQWAKEFLGDANAQPTPQNQDKVAQAKIESLLQQGKTPEQIALIWNAGTAVRRSGVNKYGVKYDSGAYADKVIKQLMS